MTKTTLASLASDLTALGHICRDVAAVLRQLPPDESFPSSIGRTQNMIDALASRLGVLGDILATRLAHRQAAAAKTPSAPEVQAG